MLLPSWTLILLYASTHDDGWAYYNRGLARYYLGRTWEATRDFQTSLALAKRTGDKRLESPR